jgi:hypothetical protein
MLFSKFIKQKKAPIYGFFIMGIIKAHHMLAAVLSLVLSFDIIGHDYIIYVLQLDQGYEFRSSINNLAEFSQVNYFFHVQTFCIFYKKKLKPCSFY